MAGAPNMLGDIFSGLAAPKPQRPEDLLVKRTKSVGNALGDLGNPVQLSALV
jgi:hypothetical protein